MNGKKKEDTGKPKPEHQIRCGEITASIYRRQSNTGYGYLTYELSRRYRAASTGKDSRTSTLLFEGNEQDLMQAISKASAWIRDNANGDPSAPTQDTKPPSN